MQHYLLITENAFGCCVVFGGFMEGRSYVVVFLRPVNLGGYVRFYDPT